MDDLDYYDPDQLAPKLNGYGNDDEIPFLDRAY